MSRVRLCAWIAVVAALGAGRPSSVADAPDPRADALIRQLADPDAEARRKAAEGLIRLGPSVRPAVLAASRCDDPAIASAVSMVLMALPWNAPGDPPPVHAALDRYGSRDEPGRIAIVSQLAEMNDRAGIPALLRLIVEDPSEDVCWNIELQIRNRRDSTIDGWIREIVPPDDKPAANVLAARGWIWKDRQRGLQLLRQALVSESLGQTYDYGELDYAFEKLSLAAIAAGEFDEAAELKRKQCARIGVTRDAYPLPVYELFAMHAHYGPLSGFESDIQRFEAYLGHPQVLYALAHLEARQARSAEAQALELAAAGSSISGLQRLLVARFLESQNWSDWARREAYAAVRSDDTVGINVRYNGILLLLALTAADDDYAAGVEHLTTATQLIDQLASRRRAPGASLYDENELAAELAWRNAKIALARSNRPEAQEHMQRFIQADPKDSEAVLNAYPLLQELQLKEPADKLFTRCFDEAMAQMRQDPDNPQLMNQLAWFCARCDRNLDQALAAATRAVAIEPDNAAFIDTLAEVQFRRGNAAEAAKLESRALALEPGDIFMLRQLERFRMAGAAPR